MPTLKKFHIDHDAHAADIHLLFLLMALILCGPALGPSFQLPNADRRGSEIITDSAIFLCSIWGPRSSYHGHTIHWARTLNLNQGVCTRSNLPQTAVQSQEDLVRCCAQVNDCHL